MGGSIQGGGAAQAADLDKVIADISAPTKPVSWSPSRPGSTIKLETRGCVSLTVALKAIVDPARGAGQSAPLPGDRFLATKFTVTNRSSSQSLADAANINATVVRSNSQTYTSAIADVAGCSNFANGDYQLAPGAAATGCVVFQLPASVKATAVKWTVDSGSGELGEWKVRPTDVHTAPWPCGQAAEQSQLPAMLTVPPALSCTTACTVPASELPTKVTVPFP